MTPVFASQLNSYIVCIFSFLQGSTWVSQEKNYGAEMISCGLATHYAHSLVKIVGPFHCFNHLSYLYNIVLPPFFHRSLH